MKQSTYQMKLDSLGILLFIFLGLSALISSCTKEPLTDIEVQQVENESEIDQIQYQVVNGDIYYLKGNNGKYVSHENGTKDMICNRTNKGSWERFYLRQGSTGFWYIKGVSHDKYVSMENGVKDMRCNRNSVGAWEKFDIEIVGSANGNDVVAFKSRHNNKYVSSENGTKDMICNRNNIGAWEKFELVPDGGSSNDDTAADIIGSGWKLNGYTGNLNVGSNNNGLSYADNASTNESHFFFEKNGYAAFRTYPGNPTSGGSSNPRSELREIINGGNGYWNGNTNTEHSMKWRFRIEDLPPSGKLCFGQIHERDNSYDDVIRVQVQGNSGQNSGSVDLRILGYVTEEINGSGETVNFNMNMDTEYYFELTMKNGVVKLYNLNKNNGNRIGDPLFESVDIGNANENYFKAGCYLQSTSSSHSGSSVYGQVLIKDLSVNPDN